MKYKVGDKVRVESLEWYYKNKGKYDRVNCTESVFFDPNMSRFCGSILTIKNLNLDTGAYEVEENSYYWTDEMLEGLAKDTIQPIVFENIIAKKVELCLGDDYEVVVEDGRTFVQKKKPKYPTTYEECCKVLGSDSSKIIVLSNRKDIIHEENKHCYEMYNLYHLLICRDAYWKIAGKEMGLEKSWEPDYNNKTEKYVVYPYQYLYSIDKEYYRNTILSFPTKEMRDAFYENFKDLIENCKTLL